MPHRLLLRPKWNTPVRVKSINDLKLADGTYLPHLLPVDQTLHWANPPRRHSGARDNSSDVRGKHLLLYSIQWPSADGHTTCTAQLVSAMRSDGYAEAWYLPAANNIPLGYASEGTWYDFFKAKGTMKFW